VIVEAEAATPDVAREAGDEIQGDGRAAETLTRACMAGEGREAVADHQAHERRSLSGDKAKYDAAVLVADTIGSTREQPWSQRVLAASAKTDNGKHVVRIELDPKLLAGLSADDRVGLQGRIIASLPENVRKLMPHVRIDMHGVLAADRRGRARRGLQGGHYHRQGRRLDAAW
jgi:hypothetical protein